MSPLLPVLRNEYRFLLLTASVYLSLHSYSGSKVKSLNRLALVVGDPAEEGGASASGSAGDRAWEALLPSLAHVVAWFEWQTGVPSIALYDARGVLKSQWGAKGLRRELLRIEGEQDRSVGCAIKLLSREDWDECLFEFAAQQRAGNGGSGESQARLEEWIESYRVEELELHGGEKEEGAGVPAPSLGKPPDLIVVLSEKCFTLSGFFPWHAKSAEIYQVRKHGCAGSVAELDRELEGVLQKFFKTLRRGGK